jgi:hypothetical protein
VSKINSQCRGSYPVYALTAKVQFAEEQQEKHSLKHHNRTVVEEQKST